MATADVRINPMDRYSACPMWYGQM